MFGLYEVLEDYAYGMSDQFVRACRAATVGLTAYLMSEGTSEVLSLHGNTEGLVFMALGAVVGRAALSFNSVCEDNAVADSLEHMLADEIE